MAEINSNNALRGVTTAAGADKRFWSFRNSTETGGDAELVLYGSISSTSWWGDEVTPKQFSDDLKALGDIQALTVRINSGGGDVFAAFAIYNRLLDLRKKGVKVSAVVDGHLHGRGKDIHTRCGDVHDTRPGGRLLRLLQGGGA